MLIITRPTIGYIHTLIKGMVVIVAGLGGVSANFTEAKDNPGILAVSIDTTEAGYLSNDLYLFADGIYENPVNDGVSAKVSPELSAMDNLLFSMPVSRVLQHRLQDEDKPQPSRMDYQLDVLMDGVGLSFSYGFR